MTPGLKTIWSRCGRETRSHLREHQLTPNGLAVGSESISTRRKLVTKMRMANGLIILGVLAWLPFFWQLSQGARPNIFPYLILHLTGVLSGAWLRSRRPVGSDVRAIGKGRILASKILIYLGVLAWVPYFYLTRIEAADVEMTGFLAAHLTGVLGGAALRGSVEIQRLVASRRGAVQSDD